jgi:hypothetical protein
MTHSVAASPLRLLRAVVAVLMAASLSVSSPAGTDPGTQEQADRTFTPIRDPQHRFQRRTKSWQEIRTQNIVMQQRDYSCGAAALATVIRYHWGDNVTETQILQEVFKLLTIEELKERIENGLSLTDLRRLAVKLGYQAAIGKLEFEKLKESKVPLIVGLSFEDFDHFAVFRGTDGVYVYLADPARGNVRVPVHEFEAQWQKNAVLVVVKPGVDPKKVSPLNLDPLEVFLGETNRLYLRDRVSGPQFALPSAGLP